MTIKSIKLFVFLFGLFVLARSAYAEVTTATANATVVEGVFSQVSKLPAAAGNPYPDCYYTATLDLQHIVSGQSIPRRIVLVLPGFFSRQYAPEANYKVGDKVRAVVVPFASMPEKVRQTQQADEVEDVDLEFYYPEKIVPVTEFGDVKKSIPFSVKSKKAEKVFPIQAIDLKARAARKEAMQHDLEQIDKLLAEHGGNWDKWYNSLSHFREEYKRQYEAKATRWIGNSFFTAGTIDIYNTFSDEFLTSLVAFKKYLAARNVDLIVVRFPNKGEIVDDLFTSIQAADVGNPYLLRMYKALLESDIEIITDIIPRAKQARLKYPLMYWYQDFTEPHPAEGIAWVVAEALAERLGRYETIRNAVKVTLKRDKTTTGTEKGSDSHIFYWPEGNSNFDAGKYSEFTRIVQSNDSALIPKQGVNSPILIAGTSFIDYPQLRLGGNVPAYVAYLTGIVPDILFRSGTGTDIPRTLAREGEAFLRNRTVCLLPIQPWFFYSPLSLPPVVDPGNYMKILLTSYTKTLGEQLEVSAQTPRHVFSFSTDGSINVSPASADSRTGGTFRLKLPNRILEFPFFAIELDTRVGDAAAVKGRYGSQVDMVQKSYSQTNQTENLIFRSEGNNVVDLEFSNITIVKPTVIKGINIYGLQP